MKGRCLPAMWLAGLSNCDRRGGRRGVTIAEGRRRELLWAAIGSRLGIRVRCADDPRVHRHGCGGPQRSRPGGRFRSGIADAQRPRFPTNGRTCGPRIVNAAPGRACRPACGTRRRYYFLRPSLRGGLGQAANGWTCCVLDIRTFHELTGTGNAERFRRNTSG